MIMAVSTRYADSRRWPFSVDIAIPAKSESWQEAFHHDSQSDTALHDFNTEYEVQPPDGHGLWFRMLFAFALHHS
jgi:hypothetical protein